MSAGQRGAGALRPDDDLAKLAPKFREAVMDAVAECHELGYDVDVYEGLRTQALQSVYYARGRTEIPPEKPVTNASDVLHSWHGYGLAVDVISQSEDWGAGDSWYAAVAEVFKRHACDWGGDWTDRKRDQPHFQWGALKPGPSTRARALLTTGGITAVWREVGAL